MQSSPLLPEPSFPFVATGHAAGFVASLPTDRRLATVDVAGSLAHVEMLRRAGLLTRQEAKSLAAAWRACRAEIESGTFPWREDLEDVHTNLEARAMELAGPAGGKVHAGRSRNDQVALDERLFVRLAIETVLGRVADLQSALLEQAKARVDVVVPGYTHLRRAQPVLISHMLLAHFWRLARDADRLHDAFARVNISPAGAGAVAGTSLPIDPTVVADLLGFDRAAPNSLDATSDRDYFVEVVGDLALLSVHVSGLCEDLMLWTTTEFGFASLAGSDTAGSSLLPQKVNPDPIELARGQAGSVVGDLVALLSLAKGLPLGYHRDLQAAKASAFRAIDTVTEGLASLAGVVTRLAIHGGGTGVGTAPAEASVLLVEHLVARGVPFRDAYDLVRAHLPAIAEAPEGEGRAAALRKASKLFDDGAASLLTPGGAVAAIVSPGGTGPSRVASQIQEAEAALGRQAYHMTLIAKKNRRISDVLSGGGVP